MSDLHAGVLKGHQKNHAFYLSPPANLVLSTVSAAEKETFATPTPTTAPFRIYTAIPTYFYRPGHPKNHSITISISSNSANPSISPPAIVKALPPPSVPVASSSHNDTTSLTKTSAESKDLTWLTPLLGALGALGVIAIVAAIVFFCYRRRNKEEVAMLQRQCRQQQQFHTFNSSYQQRTLTNSFQSWNSCSTIRNDENRKRASHIFSPVAVTDSNNCITKQKRWTADTLVEEPSLAMLKNQYSPQLAFSPSLFADELQQQQHLSVPETAFSLVSPSNTLIDNDGVLSSTDLDQKKSYFHHLERKDHRPRIEMYEPQVNLHEDPLETPYP